jgi:hypothetical protein
MESKQNVLLILLGTKTTMIIQLISSQLYLFEVIKLVFKQTIDGIDKLPRDFVDKMIEFGLFDAKMCAHTVAKYETRNHIKKTFVKDRAPIATHAEVRLII